MTRTAHTMTAREYVESQGVTPQSSCIDIIDAYYDWLSERRPDLDMEDLEDRSYKFYERYAR